MKIKSIRQVPSEETFNLHVQDNENYFANGVLVHNCHRFASEETSGIIRESENAKIKIGVTGTIPEDPTAAMELYGLFGKPRTFITSRELIDRGLGTPIQIKSLIFKYSNADKDLIRENKNYIKMVRALEQNQPRFEFVIKLLDKLSSRNENTLALFAYTDFGKEIFTEIMRKKFPDVKVENKNIVGKHAKEFQEKYNVYFINGETTGKDREYIRQVLETKRGAILVSNYALLSTGVNLKALWNLVFCEPRKSYTMITQSIGRGMRLHPEKEIFTVWDLVDDIGYRDFTGLFVKAYKHRLAMSYNPEEYPVQEINVKLS